MKIFVLAVSSLLLSSVTFAQGAKGDLTPTVALMSPDVQYQPSGCDINTRLVLDNAQLSGKIAYLENYVAGFCEIYVPAFKRFMLIDSTTTDDCGSILMKATLESVEDRIAVEIVDHRNRLCDDIFPALIVVKMSSSMGLGQEMLYSFSVK
jgi:hypothetical protein